MSPSASNLEILRSINIFVNRVKTYLDDMNGKSYDLNYFKEFAQQQGGECLSTDYSRLKYKLEWKCKEGHIFMLEPQKIISRNYWCPECTGRRTLNTVESMQKVATKRGWKFLSPEFTIGTKKYKFQCDKGHIIYMIADNVIKGNGCRTCAGKQLLTIDIFKKIAIEKGGECLSDKYQGTGTKLKFRCKEGHVFKTIPGEIKNAGAWCKKCAGLERGTIEEMRELAESRGGKCLSKEYINSNTQLKWQCNDNHTWKATPRDIKHSQSWCPHCTWYKGERKCKYILEKLLNTEFPKTRRVLESGLELDGYSEKYNLAFEHNGEQHYATNHFFRFTEKKLAEIRENDKVKKAECISRGIELIIIPHFKYKSDLDLIQLIKEELRNRGINYLKIKQKELMKDFYLNSSELQEIRNLIKPNGGELLSNEYLNSRTKLKIKCKNGHIWMTDHTTLKLGRWCPQCSGYVKSTIGDMTKFAEGRGGKCLSTEYINSTTKLSWGCIKGHSWEATSQAMKSRKTWCLMCLENSKKE